MTSSSQENLSASSADTCLKLQPTDPHQNCAHCGSATELVRTALSNCLFWVCHTCGKSQGHGDIPIFYLMDWRSRQLASPNFSTPGEARKFAGLFGMTSENGYQLWEGLSCFNEEAIECDHENRQGVIDDLDLSRRLLVNLLKSPTPSQEELPRVARAAGLFGYSLPQFREDYSEERAA